jgi:hypothetical protein
MDKHAKEPPTSKYKSTMMKADENQGHGLSQVKTRMKHITWTDLSANSVLLLVYLLCL